MRYCGNTTCSRQMGYCDDAATYCGECGTELTPYIQCLCGQGSSSPKIPKAFCLACGVRLTNEYLGRCMSQQLAGMVKEIRA